MNAVHGLCLGLEAVPTASDSGVHVNPAGGSRATTPLMLPIVFQEEFLGWGAEQIRVYLIKDLLVVRLQVALTVAERQLVTSLSPEGGRDLIKMTPHQLLEPTRPMLESMVHEVVGVKVLSTMTSAP